ncbi:macrolide-inactivating glycosyltransferase [Streptomonospora sediminis]
MHIALFTFPLHGHVNPTLGVVTELVRRGHRVTYVTTEEFIGAVAAAGAEVLRYESVLPRSLDAVIKAPNELTGDEFNRSIRSLTDEGLAPLGRAHERFESDRPDVVLHDFTGFHTGKLLALKWGVPAVQLCTTMVFNDEFNPYLQYSDRHPPIDPEHPAIVAERAALAGALAAHGLDMSPEEFKAGAAPTCRSVVFLPRRMQAGAEHFGPDYAFVGPCLGDRGFQGAWRRLKPRDPAKPQVAISFGTFGYARQRGFFAECVRELADTGWHVVLVSGRLVDPGELEPLPDNIEVHPWVPQLSLLEETDVLVSHSGMGSVCEALYTGTPVVLLPQLTEQDLIASHVQDLGLGSMIGREELSAAALRKAVGAVLDDPGIGPRLAGMQQAMRDAGGAARAADEIELCAGA